MVHSVAAVSPQWQGNPEAQATLAHQSSPEDCATVFARTKPRLAAFSHVIMIGAAPADIEARVRAGYSGPVMVGEDLMRFDISENVTPKKWNTETRGYPG